MTNKFYMAGTEGTGEYLVLAATTRGRIGVRVLDGDIAKMSRVNYARIRIEPVGLMRGSTPLLKALTTKKGWKQPGQGGQHRFSTVVEGGGGKKLKRKVRDGLVALGVGELKTTFNPDAPKWAKELIAA